MLIKENLSLPPRQVPYFVDKIICRLSHFVLSSEALFDLKLALNEALINALKYRPEPEKNKPIFLKIEKKNEKLEVIIKTQGPGFDHYRQGVCPDNKNITKKSGRGIFLMKKFMDQVIFYDKGRRLKMVKYLSGGGNLK